MGCVVDKVGVAVAVSFSEFIAEYAKKINLEDLTLKPMIYIERLLCKLTFVLQNVF